MNLENLGYFGIFLAGAIPWFEAIGVVPVGILFGLDPVLTVIAASVGNIITIALFAYAGDRIRKWVIERRRKKAIEPKTGRYEKAQKAFNKYGIFGMAALGPIIIGTQFAAAASVAAGVKPFKVTVWVSVGMVLWAAAVGIAWVMFAPVIQNL